METATVRIVLNKVGSDVPKSDVTPAEAMFLHILHGPANGGKTFGEKMDNIKVDGTAMVSELDKDGKAKLRPRTDAEELTRLLSKYKQALNKKGEPIINEIWPDRFNPKLPQTFKELNWVQIGAQAQGIEPAAVNYATGKLAQTAESK